MIKQGLITKGVGGLYTVLCDGENYACYARGVFRKKSRAITPLVGDRVDVLVESQAERTGTVHTIHPRKNEMIRPAVANIDQVIVTIAAAQPAFNPGLLDRFLVLAENAGVEARICISKADLFSDCGASPHAPPAFLKKSGAKNFNIEPYRMAGYEVVFVSVKNADSLAPLRTLMAGKISVFAGPSGVGKSSLINALIPHAALEVGEISTKLKRGKHTTRAAQILPLGNTQADGYVVDTPGFSSLDVENIPPRELAECFREFLPLIGQCKYNDCLHTAHDTPATCAVKAQVGRTIHPARYESYSRLLE